MSTFLGRDYLIGNGAGLALFEAVEGLPIIDAHNHADVKEIQENQTYPDLWQAEGATDHYVWELLRKRGVPERLVTGDGANEEKWRAAAAVWPELVGNPTYEWVHLDLKRVLGIDTLICADAATQIWEQAKQVLAQEDMRPQSLLQGMNVEAMCSTDDPLDSLEHHRLLADSEIGGMVRPTFRPDRAMNIFKPDWPDYIRQLGERVNNECRSIRDLIEALRLTHDYFAANGCVASDHGVEVPFAHAADEESANAAFTKAMSGAELDLGEEIAYMSYVLNEMAALDAEKGWVFQLHIGAIRDVRDSLLHDVGPDAGGDTSDHTIPILQPLRDLLNRFDGRLKVVLYCLDSGHYPTLATLTRAFGANVNLGSAWWLNDTPVGMKYQLEYMASVDLLMNMAGMVSDSRKLLSYGSRHEMFRRCLCDVLGAMVEQGRAPLEVAREAAVNAAYHNPKKLFGL